jgi:hypothetical protein
LLLAGALPLGLLVWVGFEFMLGSPSCCSRGGDVFSDLGQSPEFVLGWRESC